MESRYELALRSGSWKYIAPNRDKPQGQLYNLADDTAEKNDLSSQNPAKKAELEVFLKQLTG